MKTGIGVITTPARTLDNGLIWRAPGTKFFVHNDTERVGIAVSRNRCIKALYDDGCEFFFLLDDDVRVMHPGFEAYFIEQAQRAGLDWIGLPESFKGTVLTSDREVVRWDACIGAFQFFTRRFVETVGYYNTAYRSNYGWEDCAYLARAKRSGLMGGGPGQPSLLRAPAYFLSEDVYGYNPHPNWTAAEKHEGIERNRIVAAREAENGSLYYPFEQ